MGVKYHVLAKPIIEMAKTCIDPKRPSICAFCSRMKRGLLYSCMREEGYKVLVLGQHLDDFAESFFMSAIHNGLLRTMKAHYWVQQEDVRVCRPLLYVRESMTALFAKDNQLPVISDNCPACFSAPKERHKTKLLLSSLEFDYPALFPTLLRTMRPLYAVDTADRSQWVAATTEEEDVPCTTRSPGATASQGTELTAAGPRRVPKGMSRPHEEGEDDMGAELALTKCGPNMCSDLSCTVAGNAGSPIVDELPALVSGGVDSGHSAPSRVADTMEADNPADQQRFPSLANGVPGSKGTHAEIISEHLWVISARDVIPASVGFFGGVATCLGAILLMSLCTRSTK